MRTATTTSKWSRWRSVGDGSSDPTKSRVSTLARRHARARSRRLTRSLPLHSLAATTFTLPRPSVRLAAASPGLPLLSRFPVSLPHSHSRLARLFSLSRAHHIITRVNGNRVLISIQSSCKLFFVLPYLRRDKCCRRRQMRIHSPVVGTN